MTIGRMLEQLNFFAATSVIATTALTAFFFNEYAKKKLSPEETNAQSLESFWYLGLFGAEIYGQFTTQKTLDMTDAVLTTLLNVAANIVLFFICYKILGVAGVDKENLYNRCKKAFIGLVVASLALTALVNYIDVPTTSRNVPAFSQNGAEFLINLDGEAIYIDRKTLKRIGDTHPDAAPEFKCVLINAAGERTNCEFHARGAVVMFVEGVRIGDSTEDPDIGEIYDMIVGKYL